jgi:hypothetical protein
MGPRIAPSEFQCNLEEMRKASEKGTNNIAQAINHRSEERPRACLSGGVRWKRMPFSRLSLSAARLGLLIATAKFAEAIASDGWDQFVRLYHDDGTRSNVSNGCKWNTKKCFLCEPVVVFLRATLTLIVGGFHRPCL